MKRIGIPTCIVSESETTAETATELANMIESVSERKIELPPTRTVDMQTGAGTIVLKHQGTVKPLPRVLVASLLLALQGQQWRTPRSPRRPQIAILGKSGDAEGINIIPEKMTTLYEKQTMWPMEGRHLLLMSGRRIVSMAPAAKSHPANLTRMALSAVATVAISTETETNPTESQKTSPNLHEKVVAKSTKFLKLRMTHVGGGVTPVCEFQRRNWSGARFRLAKRRMRGLAVCS
jgi:hypothetical protein